MTMKHKKNSRLLEAIYETANDFHNASHSERARADRKKYEGFSRFFRGKQSGVT